LGAERDSQEFVFTADGSSRPILHSSGTGGVLRMGDGSFVYAFSIHIGNVSTQQAELKAILLGMKACLAKGIYICPF
jgi:ribonuclease HI